MASREKKELSEVKVGDVWESYAGRRVTVTGVAANKTYVTYRTGAVGADCSCAYHTFAARRTLIERDGKAVTG
jgi:hypothetical protein